MIFWKNARSSYWVIGLPSLLATADPLRVTEEMKAVGWHMVNQVAVSPRIASTTSLGGCEWDEWYVFDDLPFPGTVEVFVNYGDFCLALPKGPIERPRQKWIEQMLERFWMQMQAIKPRTFVAEGGQLVFATRDAPLFEKVQEIISGPGKS